jgi:DNA-binding response OmpR family regulator
MNEKIMVVDDEPVMLALLEIILRRKGFTVLSAGGAYQALVLLAKEKPDLIILDVMMPGITGLELCQHLRTRSDTAQTPVIMLSCRADTEAVQRGIAAGADEYLSKTTPHTHIVSRVRALLDCGRQRVANLS